MTKEQIDKIDITAAQRVEEIRKLRRDRRPWDGTGSRFPQIPPRPEYKTHWFNDHKGRIEQKISLGWEFSKRAGFTDAKVDLAAHPNKRIRVHVGQKEDGSDMYAYAMDLPMEIYQEDKANRLKEVNEKEKFIREGKTEKTHDVDVSSLTPVVEAQISEKKQIFKPD